MKEVRTYSFMHHSSPSASASVRGWADPSRLDSPAHSHDSQVSEGSGSNQESDGGSTPNNEFFQPPSEGASPTSRGEKPFQCTLCPDHEGFAHKSSLTRHCQGQHQLVFGCWEPDCDYRWYWSRKSEVKTHLEKKHELEADKIERILEMPPRLCHPRGSVIESDLLPQFSPPPIERDQQSLAEPQQRPLVQPLLAVVEDTNHASPPVMPSVAYNPQFVHQPEVTTTGHAYSSELEHLAATHAPSRLFSEEEFALVGGHHKIHGRFRFPSVHPGGSTTADIPPNPGMLHIPALPSPVGGDPPLPPWTDATSTLTDASSWLGPGAVEDLEPYEQAVLPD